MLPDIQMILKYNWRYFDCSIDTNNIVIKIIKLKKKILIVY